MKFVIQRTTQASVTINNTETRSIGAGYVILMGIHKDDDDSEISKWIDKILKLRLFADEAKPINRSIQDIDGEILLISQFTLYADCKGQNRPSFMQAAPPEKAKALYEKFVCLLKEKWPKTTTGEFAADMQVSLVNDGPVTIVLE
ncbi:MAG: D-tyrosyl-tRNA(Tyr) deacylase [Deltaproteobacteria bacterium]|nr:D-tyrosyl-tRNA(Tyr) deacylase [Deltaproteobacteria bacterium]